VVTLAVCLKVAAAVVPAAKANPLRRAVAVVLVFQVP
jgi:hypothetical protein